MMLLLVVPPVLMRKLLTSFTERMVTDCDTVLPPEWALVEVWVPRVPPECRAERIAVSTAFPIALPSESPTPVARPCPVAVRPVFVGVLAPVALLRTKPPVVVSGPTVGPAPDADGTERKTAVLAVYPGAPAGDGTTATAVRLAFVAETGTSVGEQAAAALNVSTMTLHSCIGRPPRRRSLIQQYAQR